MASKLEPSGVQPSAAELLEQGRYQEAISALDQQLRDSPNNLGLWRKKTDGLLAIGDNEGALAAYDEILRFQPDDTRALLERADLLLWLGRYEEALRAYQHATDLDPNNNELLQKQGLTLRMMGQPDHALASYDRAVKMNSSDPRGWWGRGDTLLDQRNFSSAFESYAKGDEVDPNRAYGSPAWTERGDRLFDSGNPTEALFCYEKSIQLDRGYIWGWRGKGLASGALNNYDEALQSFNTALAIESKDDSRKATIWTEKGNVLLDLKRYSEAVACYQKALELEPANFVALANQGVVRQNEGNYEAAVDFYTRALAIDDQRFEIWQSRGFCLGNLERVEEAIQCYDHVLQLTETSIWAWNDKGFLLTHLGRLEESLPFFDRAISLDSCEILPYINKTITLRDLKRYDEAEQCLRLALKNVSDKNEVLMHLGSLLTDYKSDHQAALRVYQQVLENRQEADVQAAIAECLIKLGRYKDARDAVASAQSQNAALQCVIMYLNVVSFALEQDQSRFESSLNEFFQLFERAEGGEKVLVTAGDWNYDGLLSVIAQRNLDLKTRLLLTGSISLQLGEVEPYSIVRPKGLQQA